MLKIKANKSNCKLSYTALSTGAIYTDLSGITIECQNHSLKENDSIVFDRKDGEVISFFSEFAVNSVSNTGFTVDNFDTFLFEPIGYESGETIVPSSISVSGSIFSYICLNLLSEHIYTVNRDDVEIKRRYLWDGEKYVYDGAFTECEGDYYIYDNLFLVRNDGGGNLTIENINNVTITALTPSGEYRILRDCLVGVKNDGNDDRGHIYVPFSRNNIGFITSNFDNITFIGDNIRFLHENGTMSYGNTLQPGSSIKKVCGELEIDFGIAENFEVNLLHDSQVANYVEKIKEGSINDIVDYERYQFSPMYYGRRLPSGFIPDKYFMTNANHLDEDLKDVNKIKFNLFFREKQMEITVDDTDSVTANLGTWETNEYGYWCNYNISGNTLVDVYGGDDIKANLLGYLGFTDDDVYYQKDALKKSFLRLSFYDSPNRETQKLLYYSTVYFDTNGLSKIYIKDLNIWRNSSSYTPTYDQLVFDPGINKISNGEALVAELSCSDKYENSLSSDGFYIHLFKGLINGNTCTPIYMKAEFNNAKYGKTVPLIHPVDSKTNQEILPTNAKFPKEYMKSGVTGENEYRWVDVNSLLKDMYTKIFIKYDFEKHKYVWFLPKFGGNRTMEINLYEPRINGYNIE